ncbi:hypothetical protein [Mycobacteroides abscessus]|uniref:hypothetical protein n=1 Tax=Mycobacteroides abscessus TaxID=36809 RepID=UPI0019D01443|nr:hypothetical protein [Mycobacteroides abscessus]MBN7559263.1 hypothetical protein [Mycobacteroides abscessus subsp. abscessus]
MTSNKPAKSAPTASPYATGGGGTRLEHRLGALFLARLLTRTSVSELGEQVPHQVAFQQASKTTVDDLVLTAPMADGHSVVRLEVAVRRAPKFVRSDKKTNELVLALVEADLAAERSTDSSMQRRFAVAVSGHPTHAREITELAVIARGQPCAETFFNLVTTPGAFAVRRRLLHFADMVAAAMDHITDREGTAKHRCWSLLNRLWIIEADIEAGQEGDWTALIDTLRPVALNRTQESAAGLRNRLEQLSAELSRTSGAVDRQMLRRRLHGEINPDTPVRPAGWDRFVRLDEEARSTVARAISGPKSTDTLALSRKTVRMELRDAITSSGEILVSGDSGVGKSALVMDVIEPATLGDDAQAIAVNLRQLPETLLEAVAMLSSPVDELLRELTAPRRVLVIDGAEAAGECHAEVFTHLLHAARSAEVKVVVVAATEGAGTVAELMKSAGNAPRTHVVPPLSDDEISIAAVHFPALKRLVQNPRSRELLRRPIVIDLLARSGDPGLPLSDSEALDHIWQQVVRNAERRDFGAPDARERVMLQLAAHAVDNRDIDDLTQQLNDEAVDGLRRSGILLPPSRLPWERVPQFKHDLVRTYAIARHLLSQRDPVVSLERVGSPRWTLPSARIACQILLSAPEEPSHPLRARFAQLQNRFDPLAATGGERWRDVPTEALLLVRNSAALLEDAWPTLVQDDAQGVARLIRVLRGQHKSGFLLDPIIADPVIIQLLTHDSLRSLTSEVDQLIREWLDALLMRGTAEGHPTRIMLRQKILQQCADRERREDEKEAARQAELAARTPEQIAADEETRKRHATLANIPAGRRRRRPQTSRHRPYLWIEDAQIEQLALLGKDLGVDGEAVLRRIAEDEPHSLDHAVEPCFAGNSLAAFDPKLLIDLTAAYYIEEYEQDHDGIGWSDGLFDDGVRDHTLSAGMGTPLASFTHGPFLAIFRSDYRSGVALLNRLLNHAATCRVRTFMDRGYGPPPEADDTGYRCTLSITGQPVEYVGDGQVWLWYRGTGVGPYPCISALQALEFATDEYIKAGVPLEFLIDIMLADATSLAMPALALGVLVRHLENAGTALDRFLVEPSVWQFEFGRAVSDQSSGLAAKTPGLANTERRNWSLREVSTLLVLRAEGDRIDELRALGHQLEANARSAIKDASSPVARESLAVVRNWASSLDRTAYRLQPDGDRILVRQEVDPEVEEVLRDTNEDLRRGSEATALTVRHAHVRDNGGRAPDISAEQLSADLAVARELLETPPKSDLGDLGASPDGPVAVAASAVELHSTKRVAVSKEDLLWSASVILRVAKDVADNPDARFYDSLFSQGADRSAARAIPYLLLPQAAELRRGIGIGDAKDLDGLISQIHGIATRGVNEARLAFARGLDAVWTAQCDLDHLYGRCHHDVALFLAHESFVESVFGPYEFETQRRPLARLDPPAATSLDMIGGDDINVRRLTPAIRACGAAAASTACCSEVAREALSSLLAAHQRGMLAHKRGYHHSHSDSLVAARAALQQAAAGRDDLMFGFIDRYLDNSRLLAECLQAIAAAGDERAQLGEQACRLWPSLMERVLDAAERNPQLFTSHTWGDYAEAELVPNPSDNWHYLTMETAGKTYQWRRLLNWSPQVERWIEAIKATRMSIDNLVIAVRELDPADQVDVGLRWIERIVQRSGTNCAITFTLPEWIRERRSDCHEAHQVARWQRIVDFLVVAGDGRVSDLAD